jgi:hypothetical protein
VVDARAICETCGHTHDWHDRDAERVRRGSDLLIERPCYREVGGAVCDCSGFRESGMFAMRPGIAFTRSSGPDVSIVRVGILVLLLVVLGLALLYAYRSQTPSTPQVSVTQALGDINAGRIRAVVVAGNRATLEFRDSPAHKEQATVPEPDTVLSRAVPEYNAAHPSQTIVLGYEQGTQTGAVIGSIVLSLLPVLLIGGIFFLLLMRSRRRS